MCTGWRLTDWSHLYKLEGHSLSDPMCTSNRLVGESHWLIPYVQAGGSMADPMCTVWRVTDWSHVYRLVRESHRLIPYVQAAGWGLNRQVCVNVVWKCYDTLTRDRYGNSDELVGLWDMDQVEWIMMNTLCNNNYCQIVTI